MTQTDRTIRIAMNGVTGRMGYRQHLVRSILAIRDQGGVTAPDGTPEAVWGYNYHTLEGHFEQGQIEFTLHKQLTTGRVLLRIHAVSKTGHISNIFYRIGFRIFGRALQRRFAHRALDRAAVAVQRIQFLRQRLRHADQARL